MLWWLSTLAACFAGSTGAFIGWKVTGCLLLPWCMILWPLGLSLFFAIMGAWVEGRQDLRKVKTYT